MSMEAELFLVGWRRHDGLLLLLAELEKVQAGHPDDRYPDQAIWLQAGIWDFLKAYGRRDMHGSLDEDIIPAPQAWRPSAAQQTAFEAGLPIPDDDDPTTVGTPRD